MDVYLIRHPRPDVEPGICYGSADLDVTTEALEQALQTTRNALPANVATWFASPMLRARRLSDALGATATIDARLAELDFGEWEMRSYAELGEEDAFEKWCNDYVSVCPPKGESFASVYARVVSFVEELTLDTGGSVAVVCHSGVIRSWLAFALGLPLGNAFRIDIGYGGVAHLWMDADQRLNRLLGLSETQRAWL